MSKKVFIVVMGVALVCLLTAGGLVASNMGFKLNYQLAQAGGSSLSGSNTIALPFNRQTGINTALDLINDIGFASTAEVSRWMEVDDTYETHTGRKGSPDPDFPLAVGEGYFVKMNAAGPTLVMPVDTVPSAANAGSAIRGKLVARMRMNTNMP